MAPSPSFCFHFLRETFYNGIIWSKGERDRDEREWDRDRERDTETERQRERWEVSDEYSFSVSHPLIRAVQFSSNNLFIAGWEIREGSWSWRRVIPVLPAHSTCQLLPRNCVFCRASTCHRHPHWAPVGGRVWCICQGGDQPPGLGGEAGCWCGWSAALEPPWYPDQGLGKSSLSYRAPEPTDHEIIISFSSIKLHYITTVHHTTWLPYLPLPYLTCSKL